jgi:threonine dehydratase
MTTTPPLPSHADVQDAARRLHGVARVTPVVRDDGALVPGVIVFLKCEGLQRTGAFKFRGMYNRVATLDEDLRRRGVVTASAGNAGAGTALAARLHGVPCVVVMLQNAVPRKIEMVRALGAEIMFVDGTAKELFAQADRLVAERGLAHVHPCDDPAVIAGQGTVCLELVEQVDHLDAILAPTGGGGMLAGCALALEGTPRSIRLIGVEAQGAAKLAASLKAGQRVEASNVETIADGLAIGWYGEMNFEIVRHHVSDVLSVSDDEILRTIADAWTHLRLPLEPAGAAALAALHKHRDAFAGLRIGVMLSGGNVDLDLLRLALQRQSTAASTA